MMLLKNMKEIHIYNIVKLILKDPDFSPEQKILLVDRVTGIDFGFKCKGTAYKENIFKDGPIFKVQFEACDLNAQGSVFTAEKSGAYEINWSIYLQNITEHDDIQIIIKTTNENFDFPANNLKTDKSSVNFQGRTFVDLDFGDTVELLIKSQNLEASNIIVLSKNDSSYFLGFFKY